MGYLGWCDAVDDGWRWFRVMMEGEKRVVCMRTYLLRSSEGGQVLCLVLVIDVLYSCASSYHWQVPSRSTSRDIHPPNSLSMILGQCFSRINKR